MAINTADSVNLRPQQGILDLSPEDIDFLTKSPVKFIEGNFAPYIWGGHHLYDMKGLFYDKDTRIAAESWEASGHQKYPSRVLMPDGRILTLMDLLKDRQVASLILGDSVLEHFGQGFPILAKFVDVHCHMSAHLHPSNKKARALGEKDPGKEEIFIVLDLHKGAESALYLGLKEDVPRRAFEDAIKREENILGLLHKIYVKPGDIYRIPSGVIHCWTGGAIAVEISESSDLTYRIYDFRRQRPMHIKKGLASFDYKRRQGAVLERQSRGLWQPASTEGVDFVQTYNALRVERLSPALNGSPIQVRLRDKFEVLMGVEGAVEIKSLENNWLVYLNKGSSIFIPSKAGDYRLRGIDEAGKNHLLRISMKIPSCALNPS